jgi:hypothetical protein
VKCSLVPAARWPRLPAAAVAIGLIWIILVGTAIIMDRAGVVHTDLCLFKRVTGLPCPFCGTGRGIILLLQGRPLDALASNPFSLTAHGVAVSVVLLRLICGRKIVFTLSPRERIIMGSTTALLLLGNWTFLVARHLSV